MTIMRLISVALIVVGLAIAGYCDEVVLQPWTNLVRTGNSVQCLNRTYQFANGFPSQVTTGGKAVLNSGINMNVAETGGPITFTWDPMTVVSETPASIVLQFQGHSTKLDLSSQLLIEYDGMIKADVTLTAKQSINLTSVNLSMPFNQQYATLYHNYYWPHAWGTSGAATDLSGAVPAAPGEISLPFRPILWLGWEDGGLEWFCESYEGWLNQIATNAIKVKQQGLITNATINFIDMQKTLSQGQFIKYTFGFEATPVKPLPANWRKPLRMADSILVKSPGQTTLTDSQKASLDNCRDYGVKTMFQYAWTEIFAYPGTTTWAALLNSTVREDNQRNMKTMLYHGTFISELAPEWSTANSAWLKMPLNNYAGLQDKLGSFGVPVQTIHYGCPNGGFSDFLYNGLQNEYVTYGVNDGRINAFYFDGLATPWPCSNTAHGCGYVSGGTSYQTYPIFATRNFMKRIYAYCQPNNISILVHQSSCMAIPCLAFATAYLDGEHVQTPMNNSVALLDVLPLATFRAEFMGKNWGIPASFIQSLSDQRALSLTLLHDVLPRSSYTDPVIPSIWKVMDDFCVDSATWHPYWENSNLVQVSPSDAKVSLYNNSKGSLLVVSNLSNTQDQLVTLTLNLTALGFGSQALEAIDTLSNTALNLNGSTLSMTIPASRMNLILIRPLNGDTRGRWHFDEGTGTTTGDSSPYGNSGVLTNMNPSTCWVAGITGKALNFNGNNHDYINVGSSLGNINSYGGSNGSTTICAWVKPASLGRYNVITQNIGGVSYFSAGTSDAVGDGKLRCMVWDASLNGGNGGYYWPQSNNQISSTYWTHVAFVLEPGVGCSFYINGVLDSAVSNPYLVLHPYGTSAYIGYGFDPNSYFNGMIDEVSVYSRALNSAEIYRQCHDTDICGRWHFDEGAGTTTGDSSPYGNSGVLTNMNPSTCWVAGITGKALNFDGSNDYINVGSSLGNINSYGGSNGSTTICAWVKPASLGHYNVITQNIGGVSYFSAGTPDLGGDGKLRCMVWDTRCGYSWLTSNGQITLGQWTHVAFVFQSGPGLEGGYKFYINGVLDSAASNPYFELHPYGTSAYIGYGFDPNSYFNGMIDEVSVYDRALSSTEISSQFLEKDTRGRWHFDEGAGTTTGDSSPYRTIGVLKNMNSSSCWVNRLTKPGKALNFDGINDYVDAGSLSANIDNYGGSNGSTTICAWVNPTDANVYNYITSNIGGVSYFSAGTSDPIAYRKLRCMVWDKSSNGGAGGNYLPTSTGQITSGTWTHVAFVLQPGYGGGYKFYINGTLDRAVINQNLVLYPYGTSAYIGSNFKGMIDEVCVYNRVLTDAEIRLLSQQ